MIDDASPRSCVVCGVPLVGRAVSYCGRTHRLEAARERQAKATGDRIMEVVRRTGMTVEARTVAWLLRDEDGRGARYFRRRLDELLARGEVGKVGSRYFPIEWAMRK